MTAGMRRKNGGKCRFTSPGVTLSGPRGWIADIFYAPAALERYLLWGAANAALACAFKGGFVRRYQSNLFRTIAALVLLGLVGCGSKQQPAPVAPPPQGNNPNGPVGLGGDLTSPNPGNPLNQQNYQQALQILNQYFSGYGQATIRSQTAFTYVVSSFGVNYPPPPYNQYNQQQGQMYPQQPQSQWQLLGQPQQEPIQVPTFDVAANGTAVRFQDNYQGSRQYTFTYQVNLDGVTLYSTDQVALFEGQSYYGQSILKVAFRGQNPVVQQYDISQMGGGYGGQTRYRVVQKILATQFAYSPQQLQQPQYQPQQQYQQQPNYGGQQYTNNGYDYDPYSY